VIPAASPEGNPMTEDDVRERLSRLEAEVAELRQTMRRAGAAGSGPPAAYHHPLGRPRSAVLLFLFDLQPTETQSTFGSAGVDSALIPLEKDDLAYRPSMLFALRAATTDLPRHRSHLP